MIFLVIPPVHHNSEAKEGLSKLCCVNQKGPQGMYFELLRSGTYVWVVLCNTLSLVPVTRALNLQVGQSYDHLVSWLDSRITEVIRAMLL